MKDFDQINRFVFHHGRTFGYNVVKFTLINLFFLYAAFGYPIIMIAYSQWSLPRAFAAGVDVTTNLFSWVYILVGWANYMGSFVIIHFDQMPD